MDLVTALTAAPPAAGTQAGAGSDPAVAEGDGAFASLLGQAAGDAAAPETAPATAEVAIAEPAAPPAATAAAAVAAAIEDVPLVVADVPPPAVPELPAAPALTVTPVAAETEAAVEVVPPPPQPQKPTGGVHRAHRVDLAPGLQEASEAETATAGAALIALADAVTTEAPVETPVADTAIPEAAVSEAAGDTPVDPALLAAAVVPPPAPLPSAPKEAALDIAAGAVAADKPVLPQPALEATAPAPAPAEADVPALPAALPAETAPLALSPAEATATAAAANPAAANAAPAAPAPKNDIAKAKLEAAAASRGIGAAGETTEAAAQPATTATDLAQAVASTRTGGDAGGEKPADDGAGLMRSETSEFQALPGAPGQATSQAKAAAEVSAAQPKSSLAHLTASDQVAVHVARAIDTGTDSISIRLDPADLGRVDVTLDFGTDGKVSATVLAERPETLRLLQRDAQSLERAFADAGLKADSGALNFGLRRDSGGFAEQGGDGRQNQGGFAGFGRNGGGSLADAAPIIPARALASMRALDIRI